MSASANFKNTSASHLESGYEASGGRSGGPADSPAITVASNPQSITFSNTAQATTTFDSKNTANGVMTGISGTTSTSFSYSNSQSTTNTALQTISASFSYSFSDAGSSQITDWKNGSASASETDTSNGTNNNGADTGISRNWGNELKSYSSSYVYDGSNATSAGFANSHSATIVSNFQLTSFSKTGGFKASPSSGPNSPSPSYNETTTTDGQVRNSLSITQSYNGSGPTSSASSSGTYSGGAGATVNSLLTLTVDPTNNVDERGGEYSGSSSQTGSSNYSESGRKTYAGMFKNDWQYKRTTYNQSSITDSGTYSTPQQDGTMVRQSDSIGNETLRKTVTVWDDLLNDWGPSYTIKSDLPYSNPVGPISSPDGIASNAPGDDPNAGADPNAPVEESSWADVPIIGDAVAFKNFLQRDHAAEWAAYRDKKAALIQEISNPNSRMTVEQYQRAQISMFAKGMVEAINDGFTVLNGMMAIGDALVLGKAALKAGLGLANLGYQAFNFVRNEGVPNSLRYVAKDRGLNNFPKRFWQDGVIPARQNGVEQQMKLL